ncbi:MAG: ATP-binding protein [Lachnospiraceae bacterium]|nr:ATP-binding protein [Lachnospiraceae bacterium]
MGIVCLQLEQIPDLTLNRYQSMSDTGVEGVLKRHENFLRQWHGIGMESATSFHLLYLYLPSERIGQRLKVFFFIQGEEHRLQLVVPLLQKSPLSEFFHLKKGMLSQIPFRAGATLMKKERIVDVYNPMTGQSTSVHYVPKWEMNEAGRLYDLFRILETVSQAYKPQKECAFRIDLYPVSASQDTRNRFTPVLKALRGENDIRLLKDTDSLKADSYVRDICSEYEDWLTSLETSPHFRVNMYGFADDVFKAKVILNAAGSESLMEGDFSIAAMKPDKDGCFGLFSRMGSAADDYCFFPDQAVLKSWSTTFCLVEVVPFFRFPALYDGESIEIPKETAPLPVENGIYLGRDRNGYPVYVALKDFPRHAFFTGMPGSGKTNTMLHLVTQLRQNSIPFLALEPAKKEYRALLGYHEMRGVYLFSPHLQSKFPLHVNPMEFPKGVRLSEHINALMEVFEGSFTLEGPTYKFLSSSIQRSYTNLGWDIEDENNGTLPYPSLQDIYQNLEQEIEASSYDSEVKGNVRAFLQVRLGGLMERDSGELFDVDLSTIKPEEWLTISAIVELEVLAEKAKNFFVLLVCHYILETLRADPAGGTDRDGKALPVRHVIFIEEAHNIIASDTQQQSSDSVDPKISATAYIVKMLAEVRALREAIVIADQLPSALASEVTKNTGLKLVHRLTSKDDREQIGTAISASPVQLEQMASFTSGRALIYHERTIKPFEMQVEEWIPPDISFDISNDIQLYAQMWRLPTLTRMTRVSFRNWQGKYLFKLDEQVSELAKKSAQVNALVEVQQYKVKKALLLAECRRLSEKCKRLRKLWILSETDENPLKDEFEEILEYIDGMIDRVDGIPWS